MYQYITIICALFLFANDSFSQCSALRQQRNLTFNTDRDCAPVTVTDFSITYYFNIPQDPGEISIRFEWNDPGNNVDQYGLGDPAFSVGGSNLEFTAVGTFLYPENEECLFEPKAYLLVNGTVCETSQQIQLVSSWSNDNNFGGDLVINPNPFRVCYDNPVVDAILVDNSVFNCNINDEPDNPNRLGRHTQFVYGTNHNPANSIRSLTLEDGGTVDLTDGSASLSSTTTRSGVTAAYFGPIVEVPFPADGPNMETFPMSAPADAANAIGNEFEITLYNWNTCNPYNGDPLNPNYGEAVSTTGYIRIVAPPDPDYQTRANDATGDVQSVFCIGEPVYFENLTAGNYSYSWEFYDDLGTDLIGNSSNENPTFTFNNFGDKLIRLTADDPNAQGSCEVLVEKVISISPSTIAGIELFEGSFSNQIDPIFCQTDGTEVFTVGFRDATINIEPNTEWKWEFYDETGTLIESFPASGFGIQTTDFTRNYSNPGAYLVRLTARNNTSSCSTIDERTIYVYSSPVSTFIADSVCGGEPTHFSGISHELNGISPRIDDDFIDTYEWDFSFDGNFNVEKTQTDSSSFDWFLDGQGVVSDSSIAGTYQVALRVTTNKGQCSDVFVREVIVNPLPAPILGSDYSDPLCLADTIQLTNEMMNPSLTYWLTVSDGISSNSAPFNQPDSLIAFSNDTGSEKSYQLILYGENSQGCIGASDTLELRVLPAYESSFTEPAYNPLSSNCSLWSSTLQVDAGTQSLDPDAYIWTISDQNGIMDGYPVNKYPGDSAFHQLDYAIENTSQNNQVYQINLEVMKAGICVEDSQIDLLINPSPNANFSITEADSCEYKVFQLEAEQRGLSSYTWSFDPMPDQWVNENDVQKLMYLRPDSGSPDQTVEFSLITENLVNCISDEEEAIAYVEASEISIQIDFDITPDTLTLPNDNTVEITNNSTSNPGWQYNWDFGDGTSSDLMDPISHAYNDPGSYQVKLTISGAFCQESLIRSVIVNPASPQADFIADPVTGCRPLTVEFTNLSENLENNLYTWHFGDGTSSDAINPSHVYSQPGTYTVSLIAENSAGVSANETKAFYIEVLPTPMADFQANPPVVLIPDQAVFFRNLSTHADDYVWDFGDGNTSRELNPTHKYADEGTYNVSLIAQNELGCADTLLMEGVVTAQKGGNVKVPNAFSPSPDDWNNNGEYSSINDVFLPRVEGVTQFKMLVYNKWGELLFESDNQQTGWNGYYQGKLMSADVYVYRLELIFSDGREAVRVGDVTLVR